MLGLTNGNYIYAQMKSLRLILEKDLTHIPHTSLNEDILNRSITLMAPSKTFNIAGFGCSFAIIPDSKLRSLFKKAMRGIVPVRQHLVYWLHRHIVKASHGELI